MVSTSSDEAPFAWVLHFILVHTLNTSTLFLSRGRHQKCTLSPFCPTPRTHMIWGCTISPPQRFAKLLLSPLHFTTTPKQQGLLGDVSATTGWDCFHYTKSSIIVEPALFWRSLSHVRKWRDWRDNLKSITSKRPMDRPESQEGQGHMASV